MVLFFFLFLRMFVQEQTDNLYLNTALKAETWIQSVSVESGNAKAWVPTPGDSSNQTKNLSFELGQTATKQFPFWRKRGSSFSVSLDSNNVVDGKYSVSIDTQNDSYSLLYQAVPADFITGKKVKITGYIKTEGFVDRNYATIYGRIENLSGDIIYKELEENVVRGSSDWKRYEINLDVPKNAIRISLGIYTFGKGKAWFDHFSIEIGEPILFQEMPKLKSKPELYAGSSGIVLFYLELYAATGQQKYLEEAIKGGYSIVHSIPDTLKYTYKVGLYGDIGSAGYTMERLYHFSKKQVFKDAGLKCIELVKNSAEAVGKGVKWTDTYDLLFGSAGTGLYLVYMSEKFDDPECLLLAEKAGQHLIDVAIKNPNGIHWKSSSDDELLMPNFSHGTAGIAYFFCELYEKTQNNIYLETALKAVTYLESISNKNGLIYHNNKEKDELYYLGYCHGPAGTSRLFYKLAEVTKKRKWLDHIYRAADTIMESGLPQKLQKGFWNNISQCCGSASLAEHYLNLYKISKKQKYYDFSEGLTKDLISRATEDRNGLKWVQAEHRVLPYFKEAQTGFMQGASGVGIWLLHLNAFKNNKGYAVILPDSPYH